MKKIKNIQSALILISLFFSVTQVFSQEWEATDFGNSGYSIDFLDANTGFIGISINDGGYKYKILKTTNKGVTFTPIWSTATNEYNLQAFAFDMITEQVGYIYIDRTLFRTTNGGIDWVQRFQVDVLESAFPTMKFANENLGFISYTQFPFDASSNTRQRVYRITNGGNQWTISFTSNTNTPVIKDISINKTDINQIIMVGYYHNYQDQGQIRRYTLTSANAGAGFGVEYDGGAYGTKFSNVQYLPGSSTFYRIIGSEDYGINDPLTGTYCYDNFEVQNGNKYKISNATYNIGGLSFVDANKGYAYVDNKLYKTTNSGVNWSEVFIFSQGSEPFNRNALTGFNDVVYVVDVIGNLVTHRLPTNLYSYFDNQSSSGSMMFDNTSYNTPSLSYLRGGNSNFSSNNILNTGQGNERIFYKWNNNFMNASLSNIYFDNSGSTFANYYKTKQLSTTSTAISNPSQTKSVRDTTLNGVTATHTIHESMGGIFYSKSTNYGASYQTEETVNLSNIIGASEGNKNASLSLMRNSGSKAPITAADANRNVAVAWEKYNSASGQIEIKLARRVLNTAQNGYEWKSYTDINGNEYVTSFNASSNFESKPKCFILADQNDLQNWNTSVIIIPHLRPNGSQNKIFTSVRYNTQSQDYEIDNGNLQDLAVASTYNYYGAQQIHLAY